MPEGNGPADRPQGRATDGTATGAPDATGAVFLIGYRASGKTALGRALSRRLGCGFRDTDALVEARVGVTIAEYFRIYGEAAFRERESEALERVTADCASGVGRLVVATGGGIVLDRRNVVRMRETGLVVWLTASVETIRARLRDDASTSGQRPALSGESVTGEVEKLLEVRLPLYRAAAHVAIRTDDATPDLLVQELLKRWPGPMGRGENCPG